MYLALFLEHLKSLKIDLTQKIALAVSGGADSMAMTILMKEIGAQIICLIVDHRLRSNSLQEAKQTSDFLTTNNIENVILTWLRDDDDATLTSNLHQKARNARYQMLLSYCSDKKINYLMTAHNKNDQAENVLIRISRGTGVDGLASIKQISKRRGIIIIRPMLDYKRADIESILHQQKWPWINDPSNNNPKFLRSNIRSLIAHNDCGLSMERLCLLAQNAARTRDFLEQYTSVAMQQCISSDEFGAITLNVNYYNDQHQEIKLRILKNILILFNQDVSIRLQSLNILLSEIEFFDCWKNRTLHGCEIIKLDCNKLLFLREKFFISSVLMTKHEQSIIWDKRFVIRKLSAVDDELKISSLNPQHYGIIKQKSEFRQIESFAHSKIKWTLPVITRGDDVISCPQLGIGVSYIAVDPYYSQANIKMLHLKM